MAEAVQRCGGEEDGFAGAKFLFALALFGFGLLLPEFKALLGDMGAGQVGLAVDDMKL